MMILETANQIKHRGCAVEKQSVFVHCNDGSHCRHWKHAGHDLLLGEEKNNQTGDPV